MPVTRTDTGSAVSGHTISTRTLLLALVVSSPLWTAVSLTQAATREGFDITTFPLSMLATGDLAWLQITNFVVAGTPRSGDTSPAAGIGAGPPPRSPGLSW